MSSKFILKNLIKSSLVKKTMLFYRIIGQKDNQIDMEKQSKRQGLSIFIRFYRNINSSQSIYH